MRTIKTLKTLTLIIVLASILVSKSQAQDFKISPKGANKLKLTELIGELEVESYSGNEISIMNNDYRIPEKAAGLKLVTGNGEDNTGVGLSMQQNEGIIELKRTLKKSMHFRVLVPEKMSLIINCSSNHGGTIRIKNFKSEIEVKTTYHKVELDNVTGPVVLNATYGGVDATFDKINQEKPISIIAAYGDIDVSIPESTKANLKLQSNYGDIFTDLNITYDSKEDADMKKLSSSSIAGKINGGGVEIYLKSPYNNIYLRKKK